MKKEALLAEIKHSLNKSDDFNSAIKNLLQSICNHTGWNYGEAWTPNKSGDQMEYLISWDNGVKFFRQYKKFNSISKFAKNIGMVGKAWHDKKSFWVDDLKKEKDFLRMEVAEKAGFKSAFTLPLILNENSIIIIIFFVTMKKEDDKKNSEDISGICNKIIEIIGEKFFSK